MMSPRSLCRSKQGDARIWTPALGQSVSLRSSPAGTEDCPEPLAQHLSQLLEIKSYYADPFPRRRRTQAARRYVVGLPPFFPNTTRCSGRAPTTAPKLMRVSMVTKRPPWRTASASK